MATNYWFRIIDKDYATGGALDILDRYYNPRYVVIYQRLCLNAINTDGRLVVALGNFSRPHTDETLATALGYPIDIIKSAMQVFMEIGLVEKSEDGEMRLKDFSHFRIGAIEQKSLKQNERRNNKQNFNEASNEASNEAHFEAMSEASNEGHILENRDKIIDNKNNNNTYADSFFIELPLKGGKTVQVPESYVIDMQACFPEVDVRSEIQKARAWMISNPEKAKSQWKRFLNNWLSNATNHKQAGYGNNVGDVDRNKKPINRTSTDAELKDDAEQYKLNEDGSIDLRALAGRFANG